MTTQTQEKPVFGERVDERLQLSFRCPRKALLQAVQTVQGATARHTGLAILNHLLLQSEGNALRVRATDLEIGVSCRLQAEIASEGGLTAPVRMMSDLLKNLPESEVALSVDKTHTVRVRCDRSDTKILGLPATEYPKLPEVKETVAFSISQAQLKELIRHTEFAVGTDDSRPILTGVAIFPKGDTVEFIATDTHRLAAQTKPIRDYRAQKSVCAVVPVRCFKELTRLLGDEGDVSVTISGSQILFSLPGDSNVQIICRLIEGQPPNYHRVIPSSHEATWTFPVQPLLQAVRRLYILVRDEAKRITLRMDGETLTLSAVSTQNGSAREELAVRRAGAEVDVTLNAEYLLDALSALDTEEAMLELTAALKPVSLRPVPDESSSADWLCVLMPMQPL